VLRRHGSCVGVGDSPAASAAPLGHTVESVGRGILGKVAVNKIKYLRVVTWSNPSLSYRLVGPLRGGEVALDTKWNVDYNSDVHPHWHRRWA